MDTAGVGSLPVVALVSIFSGMVLALQTGIELSRFHVQEMVGSLVSVSMVREMGPVRVLEQEPARVQVLEQVLDQRKQPRGR